MTNYLTYSKKKEAVTEKLRVMLKGTVLERSWLIDEVLAGAITDALIAKNITKEITHFTGDISTAGEILSEWERVADLQNRCEVLGDSSHTVHTF